VAANESRQTPIGIKRSDDVISFIAGGLLGFTTAALFAANHLYKPMVEAGKRYHFRCVTRKGIPSLATVARMSISDNTGSQRQHHVPGATLDASVRAALPHADLVYGGADGMGVVVDGDRLELHGAVPITPQPAGVDRPA
jgi:hypothetical protein